MLLQAESKNGIVSEKIIIVEVQRPDVPCLDLVDLPGLVQSPEEKALETQKIYERQIFEKNQSLYLAVVPASARPNANAAVSFIQKHGLTERTCGVFSKCDEHMDADELRAKTLNEDTAEGEPAAEMGSVDFEYGWVASMLKRLEERNRHSLFSEASEASDRTVGLLEASPLRAHLLAAEAGASLKTFEKLSGGGVL